MEAEPTRLDRLMDEFYAICDQLGTRVHHPICDGPMALELVTVSGPFADEMAFLLHLILNHTR
jgi:hypothetical protein